MSTSDKITNPQKLPDPIIVKDCRPSTLPSSSEHNMQQFLNFGGGANPMAYKGYTFSQQGRFQFWQTQNTALSPTVQLLNPPKPHTSNHHNNKHFHTQKQKNERPAPPPEQDNPISQPAPNLCCPLIGPLTPLFADASLEHIATSSLLSDNLYLSWRVVLLLFSVTALVITASENLHFVAFMPGVALLYSFFSASIMITKTVQYRLAQAVNVDHIPPTKSHGIVVAIFQGTSHACFTAGIGTFLIALYGGSKAANTAVSYFQAASVYLLVAIAILHLIDICFTPIPVRILNTAPLYLIMLLFFLISLKGAAPKQLLIASSIMVGSCFGIGVLLHLFARGIFFAVHENAMRGSATAGQETVDPWADIM